MRYKTLLTGTLQSAIEDIFVHLDTSMRCFTCSVRYKDIERHIKELEPDLFILCLKSESREVINYMTKVKQVCEKYGTVFVILGDAEVCSDFNKMTINVSDITLEKPLTESIIIHKINEYFARKAEEKRKELERQEQLRIEKEKREREKLENEMLEAADDKKHILVIDDDVNVLKMIKELIGDKYNVGTAISGNIAMKFLAAATIVLSIPTMISSFLGMNIDLGKITTMDNAFPLVIVISLVTSLIVALFLKKKDMF